MLGEAIQTWCLLEGVMSTIKRNSRKMEFLNSMAIRQAGQCQHFFHISSTTGNLNNPTCWLLQGIQQPLENMIKRQGKIKQNKDASSRNLCALRIPIISRRISDFRLISKIPVLMVQKSGVHTLTKLTETDLACECKISSINCSRQVRSLICEISYSASIQL